MDRRVQQRRHARVQSRARAADKLAAAEAGESLDWAIVVCTMAPGAAIYQVAALEHDRAQAAQQAERADQLAHVPANVHAGNVRTSVFMAAVHRVCKDKKALVRADMRHAAGGAQFFVKNGGGVEMPVTFAVRRVHTGEASAVPEVGADLTGAGLGGDDEGWVVLAFAGEAARALACGSDDRLFTATLRGAP
jgi:hypothetical protein